MRKNHLDEVEMTYVEHMFKALKNAVWLAGASMVLFFHAIFPDSFKSVASKIVSHVHNKEFSGHGDRILVRFNTKWEEDSQKRKWRVLINGNEKLADRVFIKVPASCIEEPVDGVQKFHFICHGYVHWEYMPGEGTPYDLELAIISNQKDWNIF